MDDSNLKISSAQVAEKFSAKMKQIGILAKEKEAEQKAILLGVTYFNLFRFAITAEALKLIPQKEALRLKAIVFLYTGESFSVGAVDPKNPEVLELIHVLEERHHAKGILYLISEQSFEEGLKMYAILPNIKPITKDVIITEADLNKFSAAIGSFLELSSALNKTENVSDVFLMILGSALKFKSSDVHIEAADVSVTIRLRLDGILQIVGELKKEVWAKIISRIKLMSGLKINIIDKPQDGRFSIVLGKEKVDIRVSTLPTTFGESVVMRILMPMAELKFEQLGLQDTVLEAMERQAARPTGMFITTGPTGSGKTTTLYAILQRLNKPGKKIITLEDPVEYKLPGINQSQIDPGKDYTFAKGLRSILRQDPDIVMVGEIRDLETAEVAIQAALTGHLMLSTVHTNNAAGAIPRLLSIGVKSFLMGPALNAIMGQRLVRRLCQSCKKVSELDEKTKERAKDLVGKISPALLEKKKIDLNNLVFYTSPGCVECQNLGFKGRIGIYELLEMNKDIEQLILKGELSAYVVEEVAIKNGMITMVQDGLLKALEGTTSVDEIFRVVE